MTASRITVREDAKGRPACPKCKAPAGEPCRTPSGRIAEMVHKDRAAATAPQAATGTPKTAEQRRHEFYEAQALHPVATVSPWRRDEKGRAKSPKREARQARRRALQRKRGFRA